MAYPDHIILIGRFPPPPDGQSMATQRLGDYLDERSTVHRINTMIPAGASAWSKMQHYRAAGRTLAGLLERYPMAPILWTSISPEPAGHFRDVLTIFPHLKDRRAIAVSHWGKFASVFEHSLTARSARKWLPRLDRIVFTAPSLSEACAAWLSPETRCVIPNTLDAALIPEAAHVTERIAAGRGTPIKVLFLSNMIREKGWEDVLEAAARLKKDGMPLEWIFAGGWPKPSDRPLFDAAVARLGLTDSVRYEGLVQDRSQIAALHLEADLFVLPSWLREAQPLSIMEAMAAGTPCIVAQDGGMPAMIGGAADANDGTGAPAGRTVPARDPGALADAVATLIEPAAWQQSAHSARRQFEERFSPAVVNTQWDNLIEEVTQA